ncbi:MAG: FAD-binding protein [Polyangiales bacterium]
MIGGLLRGLAGVVTGAAPEGEPSIRARPRGLPWVHSTVHVTRDRWRNWAGTLEARPARIYSDHAGGGHRSPRTLADLQAIVREARAQGVGVRVFGSSHSWSSLVPCDGFLVDNRMIGASGDRYVTRVEPAGPGRKPRVTVPPGITLREFERWLWDAGFSLPAATVADCFTVGGLVAVASHGAGLDLPSLSDAVVGVTFVDGLGEVRRWARETATADELAAARCSLGALGLVYDVTLEVEPRYEVLFEARAVPYRELFADTDEARARLRRLHEEHLSIQVFWGPFGYSGARFVSKPAINPDVWLITATKAIPEGARARTPLQRWTHLSLIDVPSMFLNGHLMRALTAIPALTGYIPVTQAGTEVWVEARSGAWRMPTYDANHYLNAVGVGFVRATACEWSIPFRPGAPDGARDGYERVRASFAALHDLVVDAFHAHPLSDPRSGPVTMCVELRTMAPGRALLDPQRLPDGADPATRFAVPELVTSVGHPAWPAFVREAHRALTGDPARFGDVLQHLAKEWRDLPHPRHPGGTAAWIRDRYKAAGTWQRFLAVRERVDPDGVFLNDFLRAWFEVPAGRAARSAPTRDDAVARDAG